MLIASPRPLFDCYVPPSTISSAADRIAGLGRRPSADHGKTILSIDTKECVWGQQGCTNRRVRLNAAAFSPSRARENSVQWNLPGFIHQLRCHGMGKGGLETEANVEVETMLQLH